MVVLTPPTVRVKVSGSVPAWFQTRVTLVCRTAVARRPVGAPGATGGAKHQSGGSELAHTLSAEAGVAATSEPVNAAPAMTRDDTDTLRRVDRGMRQVQSRGIDGAQEAAWPQQIHG